MVLLSSSIYREKFGTLKGRGVIRGFLEVKETDTLRVMLLLKILIETALGNTVQPFYLYSKRRWNKRNLERK